MDSNLTPTIRDLYPHLTEKELLEADDNIERYLTLVLRIFDRLEADAMLARGQLTEKKGTLPCTPQSGMKSPA
jgi:hypothetical protein